MQTPFLEIENFFQNIFSPLKRQESFIEKKFVEKRRPVIVLDWGCGKGPAISGLASQYSGKVEAFGYSKDSYTE